MLDDYVLAVQRAALDAICEGRLVPVLVERPYVGSPTLLGYTTPAVIHGWQWLWFYKMLAARFTP